MYQISNACSGCHTCEIVCPMGAIYYDGPKYQIDPAHCVQCGTCKRLCPTCAVYDTQGEPPVSAHAPIVRHCDVVVCGGGSGLVSAVKAAQLGKKVILLEKAARCGGNTDLAHGFFPIYSKLHAESGFEDVREEAVEVMFARAEGVIDRETLRTAIHGCTEFFDWLLDFPGVRDFYSVEALGSKREEGPLFGPAVLHSANRVENVTSLDPSIGPGWGGTVVKNAMLDAIKAQQLDVEILLEHEAKHLICAQDGAVVGVTAQDRGCFTHVYADRVILATVGFGMSDEKLRKYTNFFDEERPVTRFSVPSDTGDAIDMLQELGVEPDPQRMFLSMFGPAHHPYSYSLYRLNENPSALSVDLNGVRWQNEMLGLQGGRFNIVGHPKNVAWTIFSQENIDDIFHASLLDPTLSDEWECYRHYQEDLDREAGYKIPPVMKADTLTELAEKIGLPVHTFLETVENYNRYCESGADEEFGKDARHLIPRKNGPFYGIYGQRFSEAAMGGIMVNADCQVLRNDGSVIPNLYGVGDATSAMHRRGELAVISELTWAFASAYRSAIHNG